MMDCPNCEMGRMRYKNANMSKCDTCGEEVPNAHLSRDDLEVD